MIDWKQCLGAIFLVAVLFVVMFYSGFFMHGDREIECLPYADCQFDNEAAE